MPGTFEISTGADGKSYFHLKAANGQVILQSQGYSAKEGCLKGIDSVRRNAGDDSRFVTETASDGRHYFVIKASNGQTIGRSQMYKQASGCSNGIESVRENAPDAKLVDTEAS
jgi:uncharacterized protein YegP (UPF0339 family)